MSRNKRFTKHDRPHQNLPGDNRVSIYIRASTEDQVNSLDAQRDAAEAYATSRGLTIEGIFTDGGVSASATSFLSRTAAKEMLAHMKKHHVSSFISLRPDRVFRRMTDACETITWFDNHSIFPRFINPDLDLSNPMNKAMFQFLVMMAELEGGFRGERQDEALEALRTRRVARVANAIPYGWIDTGKPSATTARSTGKPKNLLAPHPAQQAVLKWLKDEHRKDSSYGCWTRLARKLNKLGIPTKQGKQWKACNVISVLRHEVIATPQELPTPLTIEQAAAELSTISHAA